jgi:hypothetical protein
MVYCNYLKLFGMCVTINQWIVESGVGNRCILLIYTICICSIYRVL